MRPLALHASALSDAEYELYTSSLRDLALADDNDDHGAGRGGDDTDAYMEKLSLGVREARAWLRGRYAHVPAAAIDGILRLFSPTLGHADTLSGAEFFAVLRLVVHAESGREVDRALAFVQAYPSSASIRQVLHQAPPTSKTSSPSDLPPSTLLQSSPSKRPADLPAQTYLETDSIPTRSLSTQRQTRSTPASQAPSPAKRYAELPPPMPSRTPPARPRSEHNPFTVPAPEPPPLHPSQRSETGRSIAGSQSQSHHSHSHSHSTHNPFSQPQPAKIPPLPPRKPAPPVPSSSTAPPPPPRPNKRTDRSLSPTKPQPVSTSPFAPPPPPKPPQHVTSTLMRQSLAASKVAQSMKRAEEQLEKERVMQVLKSSSNHAHTPPPPPQYATPPRRTVSPARPPRYPMSDASSASGSVERTGRAPPLPVRRNTHSQHQPSPPLSASSLEQVALAGTGPARLGRAREASPLRIQQDTCRSGEYDGMSRDASPVRSAPPTHPDRKAPSAFDAVYGGLGLGSPSASASASPFSPVHTGDAEASPTGTGRMFRSKSMHHASTPSAAAYAQMQTQTPVRRRRPESVQVLPTRGGGVGDLVSAFNGMSASGMGRGASVHRRSSLSVSATPPRDPFDASPLAPVFDHSATANAPFAASPHPPALASIQRTFAGLQPRLEHARYKAEAGLSRRGFASAAGEETTGLMGRGRAGRGKGAEGEGDGESDGAPGVDGASEEGSDGWARGSERERDELKWPAGEGWKPL